MASWDNAGGAWGGGSGGGSGSWGGGSESGSGSWGGGSGSGSGGGWGGGSESGSDSWGGGSGSGSGGGWGGGSGSGSDSGWGGGQEPPRVPAEPRSSVPVQSGGNDRRMAAPRKKGPNYVEGYISGMQESNDQRPMIVRLFMSLIKGVPYIRSDCAVTTQIDIFTDKYDTTRNGVTILIDGKLKSPLVAGEQIRVWGTPTSENKIYASKVFKCSTGTLLDVMNATPASFIVPPIKPCQN